MQQSLDMFMLPNTEILSEDLQKIFTTLKDKPLKALNLSYTTVSSNLEHLASCIQLQTLEDLDLTAAGVKRVHLIRFTQFYLERQAEHEVKLQRIGMSRNAIAGALVQLSTCLSHIFTYNKESLKYLKLSHCELTDNGVIELADSLDYLRGLEMLI